MLHFCFTKMLKHTNICPFFGFFEKVKEEPVHPRRPVAVTTRRAYKHDLLHFTTQSTICTHAADHSPSSVTATQSPLRADRQWAHKPMHSIVCLFPCVEKQDILIH